MIPLYVPLLFSNRIYVLVHRQNVLLSSTFFDRKVSSTYSWTNKAVVFKQHSSSVKYSCFKKNLMTYKNCPFLSESPCAF